MPYKELKSLYYADKEAYKKTYAERFAAENTVLLDFYIGEHRAFFVQSSDVIRLCYGILVTDKTVDRLVRSLPQAAMTQFSKKCLIDEIVLTNNIEGVHSSRREIGAVLNALEAQSEKKGRRSKFLGIVNKYMMLVRGETLPLSTCTDIRDIYDALVLPEVVADDPDSMPDGEIFRKGQTELYSEAGKIIHRGKYPEKEIITAMEKALGFLNDERVLPLYRLCIFHYLLEYVHPFYDGNGRLGRFILSYCISRRLDAHLALRISQTIKENLHKYYKAFAACNDPKNMGDLTPFLIMLLEMIAASQRALIESLRERSERLEKYRALCGDLPLSASEKKLLLLLVQAALFSEGGVSTPELKTALGTSMPTLKKMLDLFRAKGLLAETKQGSTKYYQAELSRLDEM